MLACRYFSGSMGLPKSNEKALELLGRAADLGLDTAHHSLGILHLLGKNGVGKDGQKGMHHLRLAAIGGLTESRYALGVIAHPNDTELALKHYIIAAEAGHDKSLEAVKELYARGCVTKEVFAKALRAHKSSTDEVKSDQRDRAAILRKSHSAGRGAQLLRVQL